jgi:hypothetical protein
MAYVCCREELYQVYQEEEREKKEKGEDYCNIHSAPCEPLFVAELCSGDAPKGRRFHLIKTGFGGLMSEIKIMSNGDDCPKELSPSEWKSRYE